MKTIHLTQTQLALYFETINHKETMPIYHIPLMARLKDDVDLPRFVDALRKAIANHPMLSMKIKDGEDGMPVFVEGDAQEIKIEKLSDEQFEQRKNELPFIFNLNESLFFARIFATPSGNYFYHQASHCIYDGYSKTIFMNDVQEAYNGEELKPEAMSAEDIYEKEKQLREKPDFEKARQWYRDTLSGIEAESDLLPDVKLQTAEHKGHNPEFNIQQDKYGIVRQMHVLKVPYNDVFAFSRKINVPLSIVVDGAFGYTTGMFLATDKSVFSTVWNGRESAEESTCLTLRVKTIPFYCHWDKDTFIEDYLKDLATQYKTAKSYNYFSYGEACSETGIKPTLSFAYRGSITGKKSDGLLEPGEMMGLLSPGYGITIVLDHEAEGFNITAEYPKNEYTDEFIASLMDAYDTVLSQFIEEKKLSDIKLCSEKALSKLDVFNNTEMPVEKDKSVIDIFREQVEKTPDRIAVVYKEKRFTYRQVEEIADKISAYIYKKGIGAEDAVSILIPRCEYMPIASIGVLGAGAAYQPLDPTYPKERLNFMMKDAGSKLLICDRSLRDIVDEYKGDVLYTDEISSLPYTEVPETQRPRPDSLFILLYTSGSTGVPKGCMIEHHNIVNFCRWYQKFYELTGESRIAAYASYGFDACMMDMYPALTCGAQMHIIEEDIRLDLVAINEYFEKNGITNVFMTTQVGRAFATSMENHSLKTLSMGGETLVPFEPSAPYKIYNAYGPTECSIFTTTYKIEGKCERVPIGKPIGNYRLYVVDTYGHRLPVGAAGELYVAGNGISRGYLNRPEKTSEVYVVNDFDDSQDYKRAYRSGDIVRMLPDGNIDFIGRQDGQVKVRGFRIELTEVEGIIREFEGIKDATVQAFDDASEGKFIAAYIVADEKIDIHSLNAFIASKKPPYMVPAVTMQIDKIPLNQNQKVNKKALPKPDIKLSETDIDTNAAKREPNRLEKEIQKVVAEVIKQDDVPVNVPLSYLGLTSISSIRLSTSLYKRFDINIKSADLIKGATIESIEDMALEKLMGAGNGAKNNVRQETPTGKKEQKGVGKASPLSISQQGVYADVMRNPDTTAYNIPLCYKFSIDTDVENLTESVKAVVNAHPYLRDVCLSMDGDDVDQRTSAQQEVNISSKEMSEKDFADFMKHYIKPFDLMKAPLYKLCIVKTESAVYLLLDIHHIAFDGSSLSVFFDQLKSLMEGGNIEAEEFSYPDYVEDENRYLVGDDYIRSENFYKDMLRECESASDIASNIPSGNESGKSKKYAVNIDYRKAEAFCEANNMTPAGLYLAATGYAIARFTMSENAYISTISSGRGDVRFGDTFGMFVKTLPVGITIGNGSAIDFAREVQTRLGDVVSNERYPYAKICKNYNYAPNIAYEYQLGIIDNPTINGKEVEFIQFDIDTLKFHIGIHIEDVDGKPSVVVIYRDTLYTDSLMKTLAESIVEVASQIIDAPEQSARHISMLTAEQNGKLKEFSNIKHTEPSEKCFHELMEEQALLHPERKAVIACDRTITYEELDLLSDIVAVNLMAKGVGHGDKVALFLSRTSRFFTTLYGVLKTGAAYIPSSPDYPEERKRNIIEDSEAKVVINDDNVEEWHKTQEIRETNVKPLLPKVSPDDLVYLIYTSGSTGKPKGVMLRHRGIVNYVTSDPSIPHTYTTVEKCHVAGCVTTVAFDLSLKDWGTSLSNGLTIVFANDEQCNNPISLAKLFSDNNVDYINTTPSRILNFMELPEFCDVIAHCKAIICGGEHYPESLLQRLRDVTKAELFNTYGPTEITVSSNVCNITNDEYVTVGHPLRNYTEYIVDNDDNLLPAGAVGELIICGWPIGVGYNKLPEQTAKSFVRYNGLEAYRSGDYARWTDDGKVIVIGRKDSQVKLRGLRIELGEIERVIAAIKGVVASHIMIRNVNNQESLCAYYVLKAGTDMSEEELKGLMSKKLTDYMVPSFYVKLDKMPLTPNGKINARALPEPKSAEHKIGREPESEDEKFFAKVFADILGIEKVYADDNFFELGGSSLTVTRVLIAANKNGRTITYANVFDHPTPAMLGSLTGKGKQKADKEEPVIINGPSTKNPFEILHSLVLVDKLLTRNTIENFKSGKRMPLGSKVMLCGATGYAGIHVLHELLENYDCTIYCMSRSSENMTPEQRLDTLYFYYFDEDFNEKYADRVVVFNGDVTRMETLGVMLSESIDTVINCAANVKHFSKGTDIEDINYYGTLNLIEFCKKCGARFIQTSTISVAGKQPLERNNVLTERDLWFGQNFSGNKYVTSKFAAELATLEATAKGEISGKVIRLGTLAPRNTDGEYQINFYSNGFMNRLKTTVLIGCYPYQMLNDIGDLSPIDCVGRAIVLFAQTPADCVLFHGNNFNRISLGNLYEELNRMGYDVKSVEVEDYIEALEKAKNDPRKYDALLGLLAYQNLDEGLHRVDYDNRYSSQVLARMGFHWPVISETYIRKFLKGLDELGYFDI